MDIKNNNLIVSKSSNKLVIKNTFKNKPTKLGHVLNTLPFGIIDKSITGLGGTTLELDCNRDSIIVEPLKFTAESKAKYPSLKNKYKIFNFAVRKKTIDFGFGVTDILLPTELEDKFNDYLKHCKKDDQPLKFICVSDQLVKLKNYINQSKHLKFEDFHLLIDEIDSMQLQSDFRNVMHYVMEIYKDHPKKKRTLLSATITKFHDPELKNEPFLKITYETPTLIPAKILISNNVENRTIKTIHDLILNHPNEKLLIAYNHLEGIRNIKESLINLGIDKNEISVLYSSAKTNKFDEGKKAKIINEVLPNKINFITAAYFSGFDLNENAHLLIAIDPTILSMTIGSRTAYQIQGRLRKSALSTSLIINFTNKTHKEYNIPELIKASTIIKKIIKKLDIAIESDNSFLKLFGEENKKWILKGNNKINSILICDNETQNIDVSYMKIDSVVDQQLNKILLGNQTKYIEALEVFFNIIEITEFNNDKEKTKINDTQELVSDLVDELIEIYKSSTIFSKEQFFKKIESSRKTSRAIINMYEHVIENDLFLTPEFLKRLKELAAHINWKNSINNLNVNINFHLLFSLNEDPVFNNFLILHYKLNNNFTTELFNKRHLNAIESLEQICSKSKKHSALIKKIKSVNSFEKKIISINSFKKENKRFKKIKSLNPFGILDTKKHPKFKLRN